MNEIDNLIRRWIDKADSDLGTAIITQKYAPKYKDTIAFHCQQAVEKYLKSYLVKLQLPVKLTHDLVFRHYFSIQQRTCVLRKGKIFNIEYKEG